MSASPSAPQAHPSSGDAAEPGLGSLQAHRDKAWQFFRSIGSPQLHVAPMVDQVSDTCLHVQHGDRSPLGTALTGCHEAQGITRGATPT